MDKSKSLGLVCVALLSWGVISAIGQSDGDLLDDLVRTQPDSAIFCYVGNDRGVAAGLLEDCLLRNSVFTEVQLDSSSKSVTCTFAGSRIRLTPRMNKGRFSAVSPDRVVISTLFGGKIGNLRDRDALAFVNTFNEKQNVVKFYWDVDGDLMTQSNITFENLLSPKLLAASVMMHQAAIVLMFKEFPEQLKRYGVE